MENLDLSNCGVTELNGIDLQTISGGTRLSRWLGALAHHIYNFIDCDSEMEVKMSETLMNCI
jgi:hypothetical protein